MNNKKFWVTEDHLKLLPHLWFGYDDYTEFGAPAVDPKRPYGNSDVYGDIAEILGLEGKEDSWGDIQWTSAQKSSMLQIHKEMATILNILVRNGGIERGYYEASAYGQDWKRVN
jgi:hypothetical protein